jgi:hypothetical protein
MSINYNNIIFIDNSEEPNDDTLNFIKNLLDKYSSNEIDFKRIPDAIKAPVRKYKTFQELVDDTPEIESSNFLFGGHGKPKSLLLNGENFYDEHSFTVGPKKLFAFSCKSGKDLGKSFDKITDRHFIGFDSILAFDNDKDFVEWMQTVYHPALTHFFSESTVIEETRSEIKAKLKQALNYYESLKNEDTFWKKMCLAGMLKSICHY